MTQPLFLLIGILGAAFLIYAFTTMNLLNRTARFLAIGLLVLLSILLGNRVFSSNRNSPNQLQPFVDRSIPSIDQAQTGWDRTPYLIFERMLSDINNFNSGSNLPVGPSPSPSISPGLPSTTSPAPNNRGEVPSPSPTLPSPNASLPQTPDPNQYPDRYPDQFPSDQYPNEPDPNQPEPLQPDPVQPPAASPVPDQPYSNLPDSPRYGDSCPDSAYAGDPCPDPDQSNSQQSDPIPAWW